MFNSILYDYFEHIKRIFYAAKENYPHLGFIEIIKILSDKYSKYMKYGIELIDAI